MNANNPVNWVDPWGLESKGGGSSGGGGGIGPIMPLIMGGIGATGGTTDSVSSNPKTVVQNMELGDDVAKEISKNPFKRMWENFKKFRPKNALNALREKYKKEVAKLAKKANQLRRRGKSSEEIAKELHKARRRIQLKYRKKTPKEILDKIYKRNIEKYGNPDGPTIEWLRNSGKTWEQIINSATRSGGADLFP